LKKNLLFTAALTTSLLGYYRRGYAGQCVTGAESGYDCYGAATGGDYTQKITTDAEIIADSTLGLTVSGVGADIDGINVISDGAVSFTDYSDTTISATAVGANALDVTSAVGTAVNLNISGDFTSHGSALMVNAGGAATITVNALSVLNATDDGDGIYSKMVDGVNAATLVTVYGYLQSGVGSNDNALYIKNGTGDDTKTITVVAKDGSKFIAQDDGIDIHNGAGAGDIILTVGDATITSRDDNAVEINSVGAGSIYVNSTSADSRMSGYNATINIDNDGDSFTKVVSNGTLYSEYGDGIFIKNDDGSTNVTITTGANSDIDAAWKGDGDGGDGIDVENYGTGNSILSIGGTINSNDYDGYGGDAINVWHDVTAGSISITTLADSALVSDLDDGIYARNAGAGATTIITNGDVTGYDEGLQVKARTSYGAVNVTANKNVSATNGRGIEVDADATSSSNITVTTGASSIVTSTNNDGIYSTNSGSGETNIVTNGNVTGGDDGIQVKSISSSGAVNVTANKNITATNGDGIEINVDAGGSSNITVTTGVNSIVTSTNGDGIQTEMYGTGTTTLNLNGKVYSNDTNSDGALYIHSDLNAGDLEINTGSDSVLKGYVYGIDILHQNSSSGVTVNIEGDVEGTTSAAILVNAADSSGNIITISNGATLTGVKAIVGGVGTELDVTLNGSSAAVTVTSTATYGTAMDFSTGDDSLTIIGAASIDGDVKAGLGTDTLTLTDAKLTLVSGSDLTGFDAATITGANVITGDLALAGVSITTADSSSLKVNGALAVSSLSIGSGATLSGNTNLTGNLIAKNGATIAPGNSIGTTTVTGDVTFAEGSIFDVEIDGNSADKVVASGSITIETGTTLNITPINGSTSGSATILESGTGITGTFTTVEKNGQNLSLIYTDDLTISFITADISVLGSQIQSSVNNSLLFNDTLTGQIADNAFNKDKNFWARGIYRNQNTLTNGSSSSNGFTSRSQGMAFGAQKEVSDNYKVGFAISQINDNLGIKGNQGSRNSESTFASIYGIYNKDLKNNTKLFTSLSLGFGYHDGKNKRLVTNSGVGAYASSFTNDSDLSFTAQTGIKFQPEKCYYIMPLVSASYIHTFAGGFRETNGGNSNLTVNDYDFATVKFRESVRIGSDSKHKLPQTSIPQLNSVTYSPYVELGLAQERAVSNRSISGQFFNGNEFSTNLDKKDRNFLTMALGAKAEISKDVSGFISYERSTSNQENRNDLRVGVGVKF
jgi:hypothetical protein